MESIRSDFPAQARPLNREKRFSSYGLKLLIMVIAALLPCVIGVTAIFLVSELRGFAVGDFGPNPSTSLVAALVAAALLGGSLFGLIRIFPYLFAPADFRPSYGAVPADTHGHPFEVRFRRHPWARSLNAKGVVRFDATSLFVMGRTAPPTWFLAAVILALTIISLILFGVGFGFLWALLIAYLLGRRKFERAIPYTAINGAALNGCKLTLTCPDVIPAAIMLYVTSADNERLMLEAREHLR
jgi:hypothetical protein